MSPFPLAQIIPGPIDDAFCQIALETAGQLEGVDRLDEFDEHVLQDILRLACPAEQVRCQRQQIALVPVVDPAQSLGTAPLESPDEISFFEHDHWRT